MMKADLKRIVSVAFLDKFYIYYVESNGKILIRKEKTVSVTILMYTFQKFQYTYLHISNVYTIFVF